MKTTFLILFAWLATQIATLAFGAARVPLTARAGNEPLHAALVEMLVVQLVLATMLLPVISTTGSVAAAVTAMPFLQLAGFLSSTAQGPLIAVSLAILLWMLGLQTWAAALGSLPNRLIAVAVLNCVVLGGPVASYLVSEFSDAPTGAAWNIPSVWDPLGPLLQQAQSTGFSTVCLHIPVALLTSGLVALMFRRSSFSRAKLSTLFSTAEH